MRDYLNRDEANSFLLTQFIAVESEGMLKEWTERGNLTKEETRHLKYMITYSNKFFETVLARLDKKEGEKFKKRLEHFEFRFLDDYSMKKMVRDTTDKMKVAAVPRQQFESWCCEIMDMHCKSCKDHWGGCELYKIFENNFVPESSWRLDNCPYAYDEVKVKDS